MLVDNPVGELNTLCMRMGWRPQYDYDADIAGAPKRCFLVLTPKEEDRLKEVRRFEAVAATKKEARKTVSLHALNTLSKEGLDVATEQTNLESALVTSLTAESLKKNPVVRMYLYMVQRITEGWIPLSFLLASKCVKAWIRREGMEERMSIRDIKQQMTQRLMSEAMTKLEMSDGGHFIRPLEPIEFPRDITDWTMAVNEEKECWEAVILTTQMPPAPVGVTLTSRRPLLESVVEILKADIRHLSIIPISDRSAFVPSFQNAGMELAVDIEQEDVYDDVISSKILKQKEIRPLSIWANDHPTALPNVFASWLVGFPIYGDVLFTLCRPSRTGTGITPMLSTCLTHLPCLETYISMRWRDFTVSDFWSRVRTIFPEYVLTNDFAIPLLGRLPKEFISQGEWHGQLPLNLLMKYVHMTGQRLDAVEDNEGGAVVVKLGIPERGLTVMEVGDDTQVVQQSAALKLIHSVGQSDKALLPELHREWMAVDENSVQTTVIDPGNRYKPRVLEGSKIKLQCCLFVQREAAWFLIERCGEMVYHVTTASVLDIAVSHIHVHGSSRTCFVSASPGLDASNMEPQTYKFCLFARVLSFCGEQSQVKLFEPPMSHQRFQAVSMALIKHQCVSVIDIGCGEARFLDHLAYNYGNRYATIHGVDISAGGLRRAVARMKHQSYEFKPHMVLSQGNVFDGSLAVWRQDVDAVVMIEVVEHLDLEPLSHIGEAVLAVIHPRVFIATTPNWEYNKILYRIGGPPNIDKIGRDGTPLRCSDHRFEWTREEFRAWATDLALKYGYDVEFSDIGMMLMEPLAREEMGLVDVDLGRSTQMAVFLRKGASKNVGFQSIPPEFACTNLQLLWTNGTFLGDRDERRTM